MSATKKLTERVHATALSGVGAGDIDEASGTVRNVGICGLVSENDRDYPLAVHQRDHGKYDGAKVFFEHTDEKGRKFHDWVGVVRNPNCVASGSRGNLELFLTDPHVPKLLEALRKCPEKFGMSHVAQCKTKRGPNGREVVESIESVESVDIVLNPATNPGGFFRRESTTGRRTVGITAKQLAEWVAKHPRSTVAECTAAKRFAEEVGAMGMADAPLMDDLPGDDAGAGDGLKSGVKAGIMELIDAALEDPATAADTLKKIKTLLNAHADVSGTGKVPDTDVDAEESRRVKPEDVLTECKAHEFSPTYEQGEHLRAIPDKGTRAVVIESFKAVAKGGAEQPVSAGRQAPAATKKTTESAEPTLEEIKARIRG